MKKVTCSDEWLNVFQIWRKYGEKTPFAVRRRSWHPESCFIVTSIEVKKFPYGEAYYQWKYVTLIFKMDFGEVKEC